MGENVATIGVSGLISYCDDLVRVLQNKKDIGNVMQCTDDVKLLQSSCDRDFCEVQNSLAGVPDDLWLETLMVLVTDFLLFSIYTIVSDKINDLEQQRVSLEERERNLKKADEDEFREQRMLSMYASVTNIIPNRDVGTKVSGHIVKREKRTVELFEFETTNSSSSIEICNNLWKMINS
ncbi:hypothetical protein MKW94_026391 [Papaver nudicaule]|uniref:Uncharacterized protein n=1 Tax=Papaver nudicaule TaxID=74823 RepID=A0AA41SBP3_PAPNU|nr:hypothetical protein [Papaver nudicaule]